MEADFSFLVSVHSCVGVTASLIMVVYDQVDTGNIRVYLFPITGKILAMKGGSSNNTSILVVHLFIIGVGRRARYGV